jgi:hypothetical protein
VLPVIVVVLHSPDIGGGGWTSLKAIFPFRSQAHIDGAVTLFWSLTSLISECAKLGPTPAGVAGSYIVSRLGARLSELCPFQPPSDPT